MNDAVIEVENVWKIFGAKAEDAMSEIRSKGLSKSEVLEKFDAVVGVKDANLLMHNMAVKKALPPFLML